MRVAVTNFTGGELAPTLHARYDLARYKNAVRCMENFLPNLHGAVERRAGTRFIADLGAAAALIPFSFNADAEQNFVLVLGEKNVRVASPERGLLSLGDGVTSMASPYSVDEAYDVSYAQVGDVGYLAHRAYPLHKLTRSGQRPDYRWSLAPVTLNTSLPAPGKPAASFVGGGAGFTLRYKVVAVDGKGKESLPSEAGEVDGKHTSDWVQGNRATVSWQAVPGAEEYNIYREEAGYFGFIGISKGTSFIDNNYQADVADTPREDWDPFKDGNNPGVVAFHQQRMVLAATPKTPQAFYMSRVGDFENFRKSRPIQDDDPVEYLVASGSIDAITWAASFGDLLLGTSGSEYKASGGDGAAISAKNISITAQSYWGSANLPPIIIGNSIIHVQRHGSRVRDLFYSLEKDGYTGNDLSIMAPHLFDGFSLRQWTYQQTPGSNIWIVRDDGALLALTYMKEHDIWGWSRHLTDGAVLSVASVSTEAGDAVMMVVRREVEGRERYFLERLESRWAGGDDIKEAFFVDCGLTYRGEPSESVAGLSHLEGRTVAVLADGSPVEGCVVRNGAITLPYKASVAHVGLPYSSTLAPLPVEGDLQGTGTTLGRKRTYGQCMARFYRSAGGKYGSSRDTLYDFPFVPARWGDPVELLSGDLDFIPGGGLSPAETVWIVQDRPLPMQIVALALDVDVAQN